MEAMPDISSRLAARSITSPNNAGLLGVPCWTHLLPSRIEFVGSKVHGARDKDLVVHRKLRSAKQWDQFGRSRQTERRNKAPVHLAQMWLQTRILGSSPVFDITFISVLGVPI